MQVASPLGRKEAATQPATVGWQEGDQGDGVAYNIKSHELGVTYVKKKSSFEQSFLVNMGFVVDTCAILASMHWSRAS